MAHTPRSNPSDHVVHENVAARALNAAAVCLQEKIAQILLVGSWSGSVSKQEVSRFWTHKERYFTNS